MKKSILLIFLLMIIGLLFSENIFIPAKIKKRKEPKYKKSIFKIKDDEIVILKIFVNPDSTIKSIKVELGKPPFDSLSVKAVRKWDFSPAYLNGKPVLDSLVTSITFKAEKKRVFDIKKLYREITKYDENHKLIYLSNNYIYRENQHIISSYEENDLYYIDNFILPKNILSPTKQLLNYTLLDSLDRDNNFSSYNYNLPVAYSYLNAGIGSNEMNFGDFLFAKGEPLSISKSSLIFHFYGQKGNWINSEKSFNFGLTFMKDMGKFSLKINHLSFDEENSPLDFRKNYSDSDYSLSTKITSLNLLSNNFSSGILFYSSKNNIYLDNRDEYEIYLNKNIIYDDLTFYYKISYNKTNKYFKTINKTNWISNDIKLNYKILSKIDLKSHYFQGYQFKYFYRNSLNLNLSKKFSFSLFDEMKKSNDVFSLFNKEDILGGNFKYLRKNIELDFSTGLYSNNNYSEESTFFKIHYDISRRFNNLEFIIAGYFTDYLNDEISSRPNYSSNIDFSSKYYLKYNNSIQFGVKLSSFSDFINNDFYPVNASNLLDAYLNISITKRFVFTVNAMNINSQNIFNNIPMTGLDINSNLQWAFFN